MSALTDYLGELADAAGTARDAIARIERLTGGRLPDVEHVADAHAEIAPAAAEPPAELPPARPGPVAPRTSRDALSHRSSQILTFVRSSPGLSRPALANMAGCSVTSASVALEPLLDRGLVRREGKTSSVRYYPVDTGDAAPERDNGDGTKRKQNEPKASTVRAEHLGVLRVKVLDLIRRNENALDEDGLAYGTGRDRDDVAEAVGRLLLAEKVTLNPDGTYGTGPKA